MNIYSVEIHSYRYEFGKIYYFSKLPTSEQLLAELGNEKLDDFVGFRERSPKIESLKSGVEMVWRTLPDDLDTIYIDWGIKPDLGRITVKKIEMREIEGPANDKKRY